MASCPQAAAQFRLEISITPPKIAVQKQRRRCGSAKPAVRLRSNPDTKSSYLSFIKTMTELIHTFLGSKKNKQTFFYGNLNPLNHRLLLSVISMSNVTPSDLRSAEFSFRAADPRCCGVGVSGPARGQEVCRERERSAHSHCPCWDILRIWSSRP